MSIFTGLSKACTFDFLVGMVWMLISLCYEDFHSLLIRASATSPNKAALVRSVSERASSTTQMDQSF